MYNVSGELTSTPNPAPAQPSVLSRTNANTGMWDTSTGSSSPYWDTFAGASGALFDDPDADIIIRSRDGVRFRTHKLLLSLASPIFRDMFSLPQPDHDKDAGEGLPVVDLTESSATFRLFMSLCYPAVYPPTARIQSLCRR
jgi:hypothetical protein